MLSNVTKRAGFVFSFLWMTVGGYYIYLNNSHQDYWNKVRSVCYLGSAQDCAKLTAIGYESFPPAWGVIVLYILIGLLAIWGILFAISWVLRGKTID